ARVVPDVHRHRAAGRDRALHLGDHARGVRHEVQHQPGHRRVVLAVLAAERLRVADLEGDARVGHARAGVREILLGPVDADDRTRRAPRDDGLGEGAGAAADVEPAQVVGQPEPADEITRDEPAPAPDVGLVGVTARPGVSALRTHGRLNLTTRAGAARDARVAERLPPRTG